MINDISQRFESFEDEIFKAMAVVDHHHWDFEDSNYGKNDIKVMADYFKSFLAYHKYNHQAAILEFWQLKKLVKAKYRHFMHLSSI